MSNAAYDPSLDVLVTRLADGDRSAFAGVFEILWPVTLRLCRSMLKNEADAADAAQEAMQKIFTRAADYDRKRPAIPWALAIAGFECRTILRKRARLREAPESARIEPMSENVEEQFARLELVAAAVEVLGQLSDADREVLIGTFSDEAMSVSGATLRKRRGRALRRLREAWKRLYGFD
jgi:RNA polymerase sigma-70 factor (ECF subfamily)